MTNVEGDVMKVVHQNTGNVKKVQRGEVRMGDMVKGDISIYRPVPKDWVISLQRALDGL